jgi:WD40 repeat protein
LGEVIAVAFSLDSRLLVLVDNTVKLWDAGTGMVLQMFKVDNTIWTLLFSSDSISLITDRGLLYTTPLSPSAVFT